MQDDGHDRARAVADRVLEFADGLEASGEALVAGPAVERARQALHAWINAATGFVAMPALGRVTVIHPDGRQSTIASPDLPFAMSRPGGPVA